MDIKGLGGIYSAYKTNKTGNVSAPKKTSAAVSADKINDNIDKVEFGFAAAIAAAKAEIASEAIADASPMELVDAGNAANVFSDDQLASLIMRF